MVAVAVIVSVAVIFAGIAPDCALSADEVLRHDCVLRPFEKKNPPTPTTRFPSVISIPDSSRSVSGLADRVKAIRR